MEFHQEVSGAAFVFGQHLNNCSAEWNKSRSKQKQFQSLREMDRKHMFPSSFLFFEHTCQPRLQAEVVSSVMDGATLVTTFTRSNDPDSNSRTSGAGISSGRGVFLLQQRAQRRCGTGAPGMPARRVYGLGKDGHTSVVC